MIEDRFALHTPTINQQIKETEMRPLIKPQSLRALVAMTGLAVDDLTKHCNRLTAANLENHRSYNTVALRGLACMFTDRSHNSCV
jgi:hypothetical protein